MNFSQAINYLENLHKIDKTPTLERIENLLEFFGNPEKKLKFIHVGGTNGKGSTCAMINSILINSGYKTGLFTSPHIHRYNERIKINNVEISDEAFISYVERAKGAIEKLILRDNKFSPSFFEVLTLISLLYFDENEVDIVIFEVGVGGRFDPTNVVRSLVSIITNVDLDHTHILGSKKEEIAEKKSGIIKENSVVISGESDPPIKKIILEKAKLKSAKPVFVDLSQITFRKESLKGQTFDFKEKKGLEIPLLGQHQLKNASVAISCIENLKEFNVSQSQLREGLKKTKIHGRMEFIKKDREIILDGAHNAHGIKNACKFIRNFFEDRRKIIIFGCSEKKLFKEMVKSLEKVSERFIITRAKYKGEDSKNILKAFSKEKEVYVENDIKTAIKKAKKISTNKDIIVVIGSLYLISEAREEIKHKHL